MNRPNSTLVNSRKSKIELLTDSRDEERPGVDPLPPAEVLVKPLGLVEVGSLRNDAALVGTSGLEDDARLVLWFRPPSTVSGILVLSTFGVFSRGCF